MKGTASAVLAWVEDGSARHCEFGRRGASVPGVLVTRDRLYGQNVGVLHQYERGIDAGRDAAAALLFRQSRSVRNLR